MKIEAAAHENRRHNGENLKSVTTSIALTAAHDRTTRREHNMAPPWRCAARVAQQRVRALNIFGT